MKPMNFNWYLHLTSRTSSFESQHRAFGGYWKHWTAWILLWILSNLRKSSMRISDSADTNDLVSTFPFTPSSVAARGKFCGSSGNDLWPLKDPKSCMDTLALIKCFWTRSKHCSISSASEKYTMKRTFCFLGTEMRHFTCHSTSLSFVIFVEIVF